MRVSWSVLLLVVSCQAPANPPASAPGAGPTRLVIDSGFEPATELYSYNQDILGLRGVDRSRSQANDWGLSSLDPALGPAYFKMEAGGTTADRWVSLVPDPVDPADTVVQMGLKNPTETGPSKGRVQMEIGENQALRDLELSYRLNLAGDYDALDSFTFAPGDWLTLMEFWGGPDVPASEAYPFRITVYVIKTADNLHLELGLRAEKIDRIPLGFGQEAWQVVWETRGDGFVLPTGQWFDLKVVYHEGDAATGRFVLTVQTPGAAPVTVFDVHDLTRHPSDPAPRGLRWLNPVKIYASAAVLAWVGAQGKTLHLDFDDFRLRD